MGKRVLVFHQQRLIAQVDVDTDVINIGRAPDNQICLNHASVSGRHARITPTMFDPVIEDLGSTNGTLVNGEKLTAPHVLRDGDTIKMPHFELRYLCSAGKPLAPTRPPPETAAAPGEGSDSKSNFADWWAQRKRSRP